MLDIQTLLAPLTFHFYHANIFHLLANLAFLIPFKPRWNTLLVAYISASLAYAILYTIPHHGIINTGLNPIGLSGIAFAAYARKAVAWHEQPFKILAINSMFGLLTAFAWQIHLLSFIIAYIIWTITYRSSKCSRKTRSA